jgi:hypothetical protein
VSDLTEGMTGGAGAAGDLRQERYYCGCVRHAAWERCEAHGALEHDEEPEPQSRDASLLDAFGAEIRPVLFPRSRAFPRLMDLLDRLHALESRWAGEAGDVCQTPHRLGYGEGIADCGRELGEILARFRPAPPTQAAPEIADDFPWE